MHIDDDPTNNAASNLMWGTQKQNMNWNDVNVKLSRAHHGKSIQQFTADGKLVATY